MQRDQESISLPSNPSSSSKYVYCSMFVWGRLHMSKSPFPIKPPLQAARLRGTLMLDVRPWSLVFESWILGLWIRYVGFGIWGWMGLNWNGVWIEVWAIVISIQIQFRVSITHSFKPCLSLHVPSPHHHGRRLPAAPLLLLTAKQPYYY